MDDDNPSDEQERKPDRIPIEEFDKMRMPLIVRFLYEMGLVFTAIVIAASAVGLMELVKRMAR
ncbi:hypothetical protein NNJEOMEG_04022 [Fundidesulfovibrio magnetotacticus]|uniref:Uncharacterized protein n=1 Tax=Fundidesulfovibrio magnetotacticus TaxID=2730080 RepID=A0A6V8LUK2_9BACT|nr:hypothetical protein [Fundidesulfovibrio magnetotacticus]GFK96142.1 hypothetical protein NNJEOMEG_04022 [Fundidesulfovibrio magnetotacticus]